MSLFDPWSSTTRECPSSSRHRSATRTEREIAIMSPVSTSALPGRSVAYSRNASSLTLSSQFFSASKLKPCGSDLSKSVIGPTRVFADLASSAEADSAGLAGGRTPWEPSVFPASCKQLGHGLFREPKRCRIFRDRGGLEVRNQLRLHVEEDLMPTVLSASSRTSGVVDGVGLGSLIDHVFSGFCLLRHDENYFAFSQATLLLQPDCSGALTR